MPDNSGDKNVVANEGLQAAHERILRIARLLRDLESFARLMSNPARAEDIAAEGRSHMVGHFCRMWQKLREEVQGCDVARLTEQFSGSLHPHGYAISGGTAPAVNVHVTVLHYAQAYLSWVPIPKHIKDNYADGVVAVFMAQCEAMEKGLEGTADEVGEQLIAFTASSSVDWATVQRDLTIEFQEYNRRSNPGPRERAAPAKTMVQWMGLSEKKKKLVRAMFCCPREMLPLKGKAIPELADCEVNSHTRTALAELCRDGVLNGGPDGYWPGNAPDGMPA